MFLKKGFSGVKLAVPVSDFITSPTTTTTTLATTTITTSRATTTVTNTPATTTITLFDPLDSTQLNGVSSTTTIRVTTTTQASTSSTTTSTKVTSTTVPTTSRAATAPTEPKTSVCFIENGQNYPGNDIGGVFVSDPTECCNACGRNSSCVAFSYFSSFNYCYFKGAKPDKDTSEDYGEMVSGVVTSRG